MAPTKNKKMSLKDFIGTGDNANAPVSSSVLSSSSSSGLNNLPSRPRGERGVTVNHNGDNEGGSSFRRYGSGSGNDYMGRSDGENSWRRGGGAGVGVGSGGFSSSGRDMNMGRGDGDDNWRRGGSNSSGMMMGSRAGGGGGASMSGGNRFGDNRGAGFARNDGPSSNSRWGSNNMSHNYSNGGERGERPRFNLSKRTIPIPEKPQQLQEQPEEATTVEEKPKIVSSKPKSNPFGSATAVDTAAKFRAMEIKEQEAKEANEREQQELLQKQKEEEAEKQKHQQEDEEKKEKNGNAKDAAASNNNCDDMDKEKVDEDNNNTSDNVTSKESNNESETTKIQPPPDTHESKEEETNKTSEIEENDTTKTGIDETETTENNKRRGDRRNRRQYEPKVINSRAALLGDAPAATSGNSGRRKEERGERRDRERGPPPVVNERFARMAEEEREQMGHRGDAPSSQPPAPIIQNSRFAAAAAELEAERERIEREKEERRMMRTGGMDTMDNMDGPPLMPVNSRFAAAAADREIEREREMREREERRAEREHRFGFDRGGGMGTGNIGRGGLSPMDMDGPPPMPVNSRFAAVAADHEIEREREMREREERRAERESRFNERSEGGRQYGDEGGRKFGGGRFGRRDDRDNQPSEEFLQKTKTIFVRPELPKHLQPKKKEEPVLPAVQGPLTLPGEDEEAAKARIERKKKEEEEKRLAEQKAAEEEAARKAKEEAEAAEQAAKAAAIETDLLSTFSNGAKLGTELKQWCANQGSLLPSVQKLVYSILCQTQKEDPDPNCSWAESDKHGAALRSLVEDNVLAQVEVLWAIQEFCDDIGFPKVHKENLVQAMFRSMYKYDLAEADAFEIWKEDMSAQHERGKGKAIIQTMDWFNWLDEDDEEDDEEDYEEEEY